MIGYCCINRTLEKDNCVGKTLRKATFESKGLPYVGELISSNLQAMGNILRWNLDNDILLYRMSSSMIPMMGFYSLSDLPNYDEVCRRLKAMGKYVRKHNMRVSFHPSHFNKLGSMNSDTVSSTIKELEVHGEVMDLMGLDRSHYYPINIHVGVANPSKAEICDNFCRNFELLSESVRNRLTVENDDKESLYRVSELYDLIYKRIGVPICFDTFHYSCISDDLSYDDSLSLAVSTWDCKPLFHHSSSRKLHEDCKSKDQAHADYVYDRINYGSYEFDVDLEAKEKELALLDYRKKIGG